MTRENPSIFVGSGEASGDHYIAKVFRALRAKGCGARIFGLCGRESRDAGVERLWESERLQLIGFAEALTSLPDLLRLKNEVVAAIRATNPAAMVVADSPDFNLPLIRQLRREGYRGKIFYISPPAVWAWRSYRVRQLADQIDECLPLFRFEHDYLRMARCASFWEGHPFVDEFAEWKPDREEVLRGIWPDGAQGGPGGIVALFPGSRAGEIDQLYPILSEVYDALAERGCSPVFSVAPGLSERAGEKLLGKIASAGQSCYRGRGRDLMSLSRLVVGSSGTATVESLLLRRFMVVLYKVRPLSAMIGKLVLSHLFFAMPNVLAREEVFPELIQARATAEAAKAAAFAWLDAGDEHRARVERRMGELVALMGRPGAYDFWAGRILEALR